MVSLFRNHFQFIKYVDTYKQAIQLYVFEFIVSNEKNKKYIYDIDRKNCSAV